MSIKSKLREEEKLNWDGKFGCGKFDYILLNLATFDFVYFLCGTNFCNELKAKSLRDRNTGGRQTPKTASFDILIKIYSSRQPPALNLNAESNTKAINYAFFVFSSCIIRWSAERTHPLHHNFNINAERTQNF